MLFLNLKINEIMLEAGDVGPTLKGVIKWPKEPQEFLKQKMNDSELTKVTKANDFKDVLTHIRRRKSG